MHTLRSPVTCSHGGLKSDLVIYRPFHPLLPFARFVGNRSRSIPKLLLSPRFLPWPWLGLLWFTTPLSISERGFLEAFLLPTLGNWSATLSSIHPDCSKAASNRPITCCTDTDGSGSVSRFRFSPNLKSRLGAHRNLGLRSGWLPVSA